MSGKENISAIDLANTIRQRANKVNVSISKVCRDAGVSRKWFERLKRKVPDSLAAYLRIDAALKELEKENQP